MKSATIQITPESDEQSIVHAIERIVQGAGALDAEGSLLLQNAKACGSDFVVRAKVKLAAGTNIQLAKEFQFSQVKLSLRLEVPGRQSILDSFVALFRRA